MPQYDENPLCFVADSEVHGRGLFAMEDIPKGSWIGCYEGLLTEENGMHVLWVDNGDDQWLGYDGNNELRFLNHALLPNGEMDGQDLYATRNIELNQEITIDYGEEFSADIELT
jgi:SET domain-containing protein